MELIGKDNGHMSDLKFLYSVVDNISNKEGITITDYLALRAFVVAELNNCKEYESGIDEGGIKVSRDMAAYIDLLTRMSADLSYTGEGIESAIFSAQSTACWAFYHWGLDKE